MPDLQQASSGRIWVSWNTFSHVIDGHDAGPFTLPPGAREDPYHYEPTWNDKDPYNFVNGMLSSDFWRYIRQIWIPEEGPQPMTFRLRQPETVKQINIWNNEAYSTIENLEIVFDGQDAKPLKVVLPDAAQLTEIPLDPPQRVGRTITIKIKTWRVRPHHHPHVSQLVGIDNVQFIRAEMPSQGVFIDSVGGLVAFPKGKGGVFLNQIKFMDDEPRKSNAAKKVKVTGIILQNMGLGSATSTVLIPGHNIRYEPIDITDYCNTYRSQQDRRPGWFGRRDQDLRELEAGRRHLANVEYHVVDYSTAPVPDCIVLPTSGRKQEHGVRGIKIGKKADVLFFLQAADVRRPITDRERGRMNDRRRPFVLPTLAKYLIHYADGKQAEAPVVLEDSVDHWLRKEPQPFMNASIAWSAPIKGAPGMKGVLYSMRFKNSRPDVTIESIDFMNESTESRGRIRYQNRGRVALLAITVGTVVR